MSDVKKRYAKMQSPMGGPGGPGKPGHGPGPGGPRGMRGPGGKPKNAAATIKRVFGYIRNDIPKLLLVLFCVLANTGCSLAGSYMLRPIINGLDENSKKYIAATGSVAEGIPLRSRSKSARKELPGKWSKASSMTMWLSTMWWKPALRKF